MKTEQVVIDLNLEELSQKGSTNYLTHNFHPYPAKFIPQIPKNTILNFTKEGDTVLDPFCGCGTTLVEAKLLNRNALGVDLNPIATLVSRAKITKINEEQLAQISRILLRMKKDITAYYSKTFEIERDEFPKFNNLEHWFQYNVTAELSIIRSYLRRIKDHTLRDYLYSAFSAIIVNVSNQESNTRFAAINKNIKPFYTINEFSKKIIDMNSRIIEFSTTASDSEVDVYNADSRELNFIQDNSIDHIVTSPPYANTYDYYLYHKFRIEWLGYDLKTLQDNEIGSRNRHSSKKEDISTFEDSLYPCIKEMSRVLKPGKTAVIVIGDSVIRGELIRANTLIEDIASENNFKLIKEMSYKLSTTSRMFNPKFTNKEKLEYIMFFKNSK